MNAPETGITVTEHAGAICLNVRNVEELMTFEETAHVITEMSTKLIMARYGIETGPESIVTLSIRPSGVSGPEIVLIEDGVAA